MRLAELLENYITDQIERLPRLQASDDPIDDEEAAMLVAADDDLFDTVSLYVADDPDVLERRPEQTAKMLHILKRIKPFRPYFGWFYRGEPNHSPRTDRRRGFRSWSANRSTAEEFRREYPDGIVRGRSGPVRGVSIDAIAGWRMRLTRESHHPGMQAEWLLLD